MLKKTRSTPPERDEHATGRSLIRAAGAAVLFAFLAFLFWHLRHVFVIAFGAVVVATLLVGAADLLRRFAPLNHAWAVAGGGLLVVLVLSGALWAVLPQLTEQSSVLLEQLPAALARLEESTGIPLPSSLEELGQSSSGILARIGQELVAWVGTLVSALTGFILVVVAGAFLAGDPRLYRDGLVMLVPSRHHERARLALTGTGHSLKRWLVGQLISMTLVGVLVGLGAWIIGLPSPLALGLIAAVAEFLPLIGPIIGAVPGLLLAFSEGGSTFIWALVLYVVVQQLESNLITPAVQRAAVSVPPALFMVSVLAMGSLFGVIGVVLSGPLTVAIFVLVRSLYVGEVLGEHVDRPGED